MNVTLTPELERLVEDLVRSGRYRSPSEVVQDALRLMHDREKLDAEHRQGIARKIEEGLKSLRQGRGVDGETFFDRLDAKLNRLDGNDAP